MDRRLVTPLSSLVSLTADADCPPVAMQLATGPDARWLPMHASWLQAAADQPRPTDRMLAPLHVLGFGPVAPGRRQAGRVGRRRGAHPQRLRPPGPPRLPH